MFGLDDSSCTPNYGGICLENSECCSNNCFKAINSIVGVCKEIETSQTEQRQLVNSTSCQEDGVIIFDHCLSAEKLTFYVKIGLAGVCILAISLILATISLIIISRSKKEAYLRNSNGYLQLKTQAASSFLF